MKPEFKVDDTRNKAVYMTTASGLHFYHFTPDPDTVIVEDIAHALSMICRYTGHTKFHYSVGQHSIYAEQVLREQHPELLTTKRGLRTLLTALMHDAAEAFGNDLHRVVKRKLPDYMRLMNRIEKLIAKKFGLIWPEPDVVKNVDGALLSTELVQLMNQRPHILPLIPDFQIRRWQPGMANRIFLKKFEELTCLISSMDSSNSSGASSSPSRSGDSTATSNRKVLASCT